QHDGDVVALNQLRDLFRLERVRVSQRANAFKERIKEGDGATETVEKRERSEKKIVFSSLKRDGELRHVAQDIAMAQDHALRFARAPAGEKQDGFVMIAHSRHFQHSGEQSP